MSSKTEEYKAYLAKLDLTETDKEELIGALLFIIDSILDKNYDLGIENENSV